MQSKLEDVFRGVTAAAPKFSTPEEEVAFLRKQLADKEKSLNESGAEATPENRAEATKALLNQYKETQPTEVLAPQNVLPEQEVEGIALRLAPEAHDDKITELYTILLDKGVRNALSVVEAMGDPHIDDDFHRFLVQYLHETKKIPGLSDSGELWKALNMTLFEVTLPPPDTEEKGEKDTVKELISLMEQFYAGMLSISSGSLNMEKNYFTLEIALSAKSDEVVFYACVPSDRVDLFEKQVQGLYADAKIVEVTDDYNIFNDKGAAAGSYAESMYRDVLSIKTFDKIDHDPLNVILNVFSKLKKEGEGAALQVLIRPAGEKYIQEFGMVLDDVKKGETVRDAVKARRWNAALVKTAKEIIFGPAKKGEDGEDKKVNDDAVTSITEKLTSSIVETNLRLIASAETMSRAEDIVNDLTSAFNQFNDTKGNGIKWHKVTGSSLRNMFRKFTYRMFSDSQNFRFNLKELASIYHFPIAADSSPQLKQARAGTAPAPVNVAQEGILLGVNRYRHRETPIYMAREDRLRHFYVIGQTGTGKTSILKNMIVQDIKNGDGVCFIDPHGSDIDDILAQVPKERINDVIYFDPAYVARPMALNMLEYDPNYPEQKTFVVDEMLSIFNKLFDMKTAGGPMFEQYFRNATMLVIEDPETGNTLLDISRVLADDKFRKLKLSRCKNPVVVQFWEEIAEKAGGEASLQNIVPYITSKFDVFLSNEIMRPIVSQPTSAFRFRDVMDNKKILLINLSKGRLGEINANLIGLIMVGKILMAALSRVDQDASLRQPFYLYIDEFQNVTTNSISQILSEARKYKLGLHIAHQFIAQLEDEIKDAVFGNVGSMAVFRISSDDADYLESRFKPTFDAGDIMKLDNFNAYLNLLSNGQPLKPFNIATLPPEKGATELVPKIKELSYLKYGRVRAEVEAEVMAKYRRDPVSAPTE